jgi:uncharacterized Fe-S radical SAM superfamily protein PflX
MPSRHQRAQLISALHRARVELKYWKKQEALRFSTVKHAPYDVTTRNIDYYNKEIHRLLLKLMLKECREITLWQPT